MKKLLVLLLTMIMLVMGAVFISCDEVVNFKVSFVVDDAVYSTIDTSGNEVIKMPENPTKEGYTFEGWYWDKDVWNTPFTANSLLDTPLSSDMNVYAKWEHIHTPSDWIEDTPADYGVAGSKHKECTVCKVVLETEVIPALLQGTDIMSEALTVNGETAYVSLSNATGTFSFLNNITVADGASYVVARDIGCEQTIASKTVSLNIGDNVYYILVTNGNAQKLYTVTVRRRPMYTVTFNTAGGSSVPSQTIEEGYYLTAPKETTRAGYTFNGWNADLTAPITANKTITAQWTAHTNTPYKVEYYKENVDKNGYDLVDTQNLTGTTDTRANAEQKTFEHFTLNNNLGKLSGNINGNGTLVLKVYYTRNTYTVSLDRNNTSAGSVSGGGSYAYGKQVTVTVTATPNIGYNFIGWYSNNTCLSNATTDTFVCDKNIEAKFEVVPEMANFNFTSTTTTCSITGLKDKTVKSIIVPDYVTNINERVFCSSSTLVNITVAQGNKNYKSIDGNLYTIDGGTLIQYAIGKTNISFIIPDHVTKIASYAFENCNTLYSVTISNNVSEIEDGAFSGCHNLFEVINKSNLDIVAREGDEHGGVASCAMQVHNYSNSSIINDNGVLSIMGPSMDFGYAYYVVGYVGEENNIIIKNPSNTFMIIRGGAFANNNKITSIKIENCIYIQYEAFYNCSSLTEVIFCKTPLKIYPDAFKECRNLRRVFLNETENSWIKSSNNISKNGNESLLNANLYFYSENQPNTSGNYWYLNKEGKVIIW